MARRKTSQKQPAPTPRTSPARRVFTEIIQPALVIGLIGVGAVMYLCACARISMIECDLRRLERAGEAQQAVEFQLQQQLATLQNPERIQQHMEERELSSPRGTHHVHLTGVPPALYEALPTSDTDRDTREIRLGQLPAGPAAPLYASAGTNAVAEVQ